MVKNSIIKSPETGAGPRRRSRRSRRRAIALTAVLLITAAHGDDAPAISSVAGPSPDAVASSQSGDAAPFRNGGAASAFPETGLILLSGGDISLTDGGSAGKNPPGIAGIETYVYKNNGDAPATAAFAYPYTGGLYRPSGFGVFCDGEKTGYDVSFGWEGPVANADGRGANPFGNGAGVGNYNAGDEYALYTIKTIRNAEKSMPTEKAYVGADFTIDVSKTKIVADGFGYAANPYGAVRIWSLSDGFDTGFERHLYVIGKDMDSDINAYADAELSRASNAVDIVVERRMLTARDYFFEFSAPRSINEAEKRRTPSVGAIPSGIYNNYDASMGMVYEKALDELMDIHYFISRGELFAKAEERRRNAVVFEINFPAGAARTIQIAARFG